MGEIKQSYLKHLRVRLKVMEFNATFNNISVIMWWSVLLMEKNGVPEDNQRPSADRLYHRVDKSNVLMLLQEEKDLD